jgi:iron complex outermembrane receptor protein
MKSFALQETGPHKQKSTRNKIRLRGKSMDHLLQKLMLGGSTAALVAAASLTAAQAQGDDIEQVVVSASRITIAGYSQPTPVTVVGAAQLEKDAYSNITDAVRQLPSVSAPPSSNGNQNGGGFSGTEGVDILNLRNLGITRTLVLFDSQRVVQSNITGGVDVSTLPSAIVSRVDVVTGGASAAWGSDAVAGVVNFVLNKNFDGFKASVEGSDTYNASYGTVKAQAAWGGDILGGRGHIVLAADVSMSPQVVDETHENWYKSAYYVSNPAFVAGNGQPALIIANDVGLANATQGGIITASPLTAANAAAGTTGAAANALRGIEFVGAGIPQLVNFGNVTLGSISNGGSLTELDGEQQFTIIGIPQNRYTFFGFGRYKITDTIQASLQLNYGYTTTKSFAQPAEQTAITVKSDNAYLPASVRATIQSTGITSFTLGEINDNNYPMNGPDSQYFSNAEASLGPAIELSQRQLMRAVFTLDGTLGDNWSWNAYYQHSTVRYMAHMQNGDTQTALLTLAEDAVTVTSANRGTSALPLGTIACRSTLTAPTNGCVPLDIFGTGVYSANAIRYINYFNTATGTYTPQDQEDMQLNQDTAEGSIQGTLPWNVGAGPIAVVAGVGYRKEAGVNFADPRGVVTGFNTSNFIPFPSTDYNVIEGFAEVDAPLLKNNIVESLDLSLAGRMTSYSTSGLVETWKVGLTSQVTDDFKLRGTLSVDIRAPTLNELFVPATIANGSMKDPKTGATVSAFSNTTGNPNLNPEVAHTLSAGVVMTPHWIDGLQFSVDYYHINVTGNIASISSSLILNTCTTNINDPLCTHLVFNGPAGALYGINLSPLNLQSVTESGFDLQGNYNMDFWEGNIAWSSVATYVDEHTLTQIGQVTDDYAGVMGAGGPPQTEGNPKWKGIVSADYTAGPYSFTVQSRWFGTGILNNLWAGGNLVNTDVRGGFVLPSQNHVPFTAYLDLRASYKWNDNIQLYGAVDNALDTPPPLIALQSSNAIHAVPTSNSSYDLLGRTFRLGVRFSY